MCPHLQHTNQQNIQCTVISFSDNTAGLFHEKKFLSLLKLQNIVINLNMYLNVYQYVS